MGSYNETLCRMVYPTAFECYQMNAIIQIMHALEEYSGSNHLLLAIGPIKIFVHIVQAFKRRKKGAQIFDQLETLKINLTSYLVALLDRLTSKS